MHDKIYKPPQPHLCNCLTTIKIIFDNCCLVIHRDTIKALCKSKSKAAWGENKNLSTEQAGVRQSFINWENSKYGLCYILY